MPIVQTQSDLHSSNQKLSKIETLRLARNYILAMSQTLQEGKPMDLIRFIRILTSELSQTTANLLSGTLLEPVDNSLVAYRRQVIGDMDESFVTNVCNANSEWHDYGLNSFVCNYNTNPWSYSNKYEALKITPNAHNAKNINNNIRYDCNNGYVAPNGYFGYESCHSKHYYQVEW